MYKDIITTYLTSIGRRYNIVGDEIKTTCLNPKHIDEHPSFSINTMNGFYYCFSCQHKGHITNLVESTESIEELQRTTTYLEALRGLEDHEDGAEQHTTNLPLDSGIKVEPFRGLSAETIASAGLYYCNVGRYAGRIIFPMDDGFDARIMPLDDTPPRVPMAKYLRPTTFKTSHSMYVCQPEGYSDTVIICEGVMDALSYQELGFHAAANFGLAACTPNKAGVLLAAGYTKVMNGFDPDAAGIQGWQQVKDSFREYFEIANPAEIIKELHKSKSSDINDYIIALKEHNEEDFTFS